MVYRKLLIQAPSPHSYFIVGRPKALLFLFFADFTGVVGWCDGPGPGRPTIRMTVGQEPTALAVGAGGGCLVVSTLLYLFSLLSSRLWETTRYRLKYCLKGPLNLKQPSNLW